MNSDSDGGTICMSHVSIYHGELMTRTCHSAFFLDQEGSNCHNKYQLWLTLNGIGILGTERNVF